MLLIATGLDARECVREKRRCAKEHKHGRRENRVAEKHLSKDWIVIQTERRTAIAVTKERDVRISEQIEKERVRAGDEDFVILQLLSHAVA